MTEDGRRAEMVGGVGGWTSFRQQTWLLAMSGRWLFWIVGLGSLRLLVALVAPSLPPLLLTGLLPVLGAVAWAVLVWRGESPRRRSYHWSLPVSRPVHDLARVAAGALFLVVACALWAGFEVVTAYLGGPFEGSLAPDVEAWARLVVAPLIAYLLATPFVLWGDYAFTRWFIGAFMVLGLLAVALEAQGFDPLLRGCRVVAMTEGAGLGIALAPCVAVELGLGAAWWAAAALWTGVGAVLTALAATFRPDDLRRRFQRQKRASAR